MWVWVWVWACLTMRVPACVWLCCGRRALRNVRRGPGSAGGGGASGGAASSSSSSSSSAPKTKVPYKLASHLYETIPSGGDLDKEECVICLDDFADPSNPAVRLINCTSHWFHLPCIERQFQEKTQCPVCKVGWWWWW